VVHESSQSAAVDLDHILEGRDKNGPTLAELERMRTSADPAERAEADQFCSELASATKATIAGTYGRSIAAAIATSDVGRRIAESFQAAALSAMPKLDRSTLIGGDIEKMKAGIGPMFDERQQLANAAALSRIVDVQLAPPPPDPTPTLEATAEGVQLAAERLAMLPLLLEAIEATNERLDQAERERAEDKGLEAQRHRWMLALAGVAALTGVAATLLALVA
jgi:hypothetical protein